MVQLLLLQGGVKPGMIILGKHRVSIYPNTGIMWENKGNIIFEGTAFIGGNSYISTGSKAEVVFGNRFTVYTSMKLVSYHRVRFGTDCLVGWDCMISDTDLHSITRLDGSLSRGYGEIRVGNQVWIANGCKLYKNTVIPDHTVVAGNTVVSKSCSNFPEYSVIGNKQELCVISKGWLDMNNNKVIYE